jgi:hypothetical protein
MIATKDSALQPPPQAALLLALLLVVGVSSGLVVGVSASTNVAARPLHRDADAPARHADEAERLRCLKSWHLKQGPSPDRQRQDW